MLITILRNVPQTTGRAQYNIGIIIIQAMDNNIILVDPKKNPALSQIFRKS